MLTQTIKFLFLIPLSVIAMLSIRFTLGLVQ